MNLHRILYFLNFIIFFIFYTLSYLTHSQWKSIIIILQNKKTNSKIRSCVNKIIFENYKKWSYKKAKEFKKLHYYKCRNINIVELENYSLYGLSEAIRNYNASNVNFIKYADFYVSGCLMKGLNDLLPLSTIPRRLLKNKKWRLENQYLYKKSLNPIFFGFDYWKIEKNQPQNYNLQIYDEKCDFLWKKINKLDNFSKNVFYLKYDYYFFKIRSNEQIGTMMNCSGEKIRLILKNIF